MPGTVDPVAFAKARTAEVMLLKKEIQDAQYRGTRRVFQTLPRTMRRRAASYNIRRLPVRLRQKALEEAAKDPATVQKTIKKPPCRRRRRRPRDLVKEFGQRRQKKGWLETHLWHAKRAHMEDLWGYRIATRSNEKCLKSCLRASRAGCFLYDKSYYELVSVQCLDDMIGAVADEVLSEIQTAASSIPEGGHNFWDILLFKKDSRDPLGPATIILSKEDRIFTIKLLIHPLIASDVAEQLSKSSISKSQYSIFEFEGNQALATLNCIFNLQMSSLSELPSTRAVWGLNVVDPRFAFPQSIGTIHKEHLAMANTRFWDEMVNCQALERRKSEKVLDGMRGKFAIPGIKLQPGQDDPRMPVLLLINPIKLPDGRLHHRWTVLVPHGWGHSFWRSLIFCKVRFGALREYNMVALEHGRPVFPLDFANCNNYSAHMENDAGLKEAKWNRTPPAKRINYTKLGITSPFRLELIQLDCQPKELSICRIEMVDRGVSEFNARVLQGGVLIGLVTSGIYSQLRGRGIAFASCRLNNASLPAHITVRNVDGGPERPAIITQMI